MSAHTPLCIGCNKRPSEIEEYIDAVEEEGDGQTPDEYVRAEEGTYNPTNGHFLCTNCYIKVPLYRFRSGRHHRAQPDAGSRAGRDCLGSGCDVWLCRGDRFVRWGAGVGVAAVKLTPWYPSKVKPVHHGVYQRDIPGVGIRFSFWNGAFWGGWCYIVSGAVRNKDDISSVQNANWRGLSERPK